MGKQMEGDNAHRRKLAREAREEGKKPSESGATLGASKQTAKADASMSHQKRIDLKREGKHDVTSAHTPEARPGSRDPDTPDREQHPRLKDR
jgi:hypothetical protein